MRPPSIDDQTLYEKLMSVLRAKGYDGSSLADLAQASGLAKASLYHRFKNKEQIASVVLDYAKDWVKAHIYELLLKNSLRPEERLKQVLINIEYLYGEGEKICILRAMSLKTGLELFGEQIQESMQYWIDGFSHLAREFGFSEKLAQEMAHQALIQIQGSLVVSKGLGSNQYFKNALKTIEKMFLEK